MARKATVDRDIVLNMLLEGQTTQHIADKFKVSRQAIDLHRKDFITKGLLPNKRAFRTKSTTKEIIPQKEKTTPPKPFPASKEIATLDEHIDLIINAFKALKRIPQLEVEFEKLKKEHDKALNEIERLKKNEEKRTEQESRWQLTWRQNDKNPTKENNQY
ncbi:hypothetical protein ACFLWR_01685 [Chloroflexota bacterium]